MQPTDVLYRFGDAAVVQAMALGSDRAYREFRLRHRNHLWKLVNRAGVYGAAGTALTEDTLLHAFRRAGEHRAGEPVDVWLAALCRELLDRAASGATQPCAVTGATRPIKPWQRAAASPLARPRGRVGRRCRVATPAGHSR